MSTSPPSSSPSSGKNILIATGIGIAALGTAYLAYKVITKEEENKPTSTPTKKTDKPTTTTAPTTTTTTTPNQTPSISEDEVIVYEESNATVDISKWKEYSNPELGIKFKHPPNYNVTLLLNEFNSFVFNITPNSGKFNVVLTVVYLLCCHLL
jgi:hypothetical protein